MLGVENVLTFSGLEYYLMRFVDALATWSPDVIDHAITLVWPVLKPMLAGSLPLGLIVATVIYYTLRPLIAAYQRARATAYLSEPTPV